MQLFVLFFLAVQAAAITSTTKAATGKPLCHDYLLIDARGTGELQTTSLGFYSIISQVLKAFPGGAKHDAVYPAAADLTQITTLIGAADIVSFIDAGLEMCPHQRYALLSYSQGATVINEVLRHYSIDGHAGQAIDAVVVIGNPYHMPDKRGNVDENGGSATASATGSLAFLGITIPDSWYTSGRVLDICFTDDNVCNGLSINNIFSPTHLFYSFSQSVQTLGTEFLVSKISPIP